MPLDPIDNRKQWSVQVEEDPETKELLLPLPDELLSHMGWTTATELNWSIDEQGQVSIFHDAKKHQTP